MREFVKNLIQLIFSPTRGWEDMMMSEREQFKKYRSQCIEKSISAQASSFHKSEAEWNEQAGVHRFNHYFIPAIALCSCSSFIKIFFDSNINFLEAFQLAIITFVSLFLAAQIAKYAFQMFMPVINGNPDEENKGRWNNLIMYSVTFLGIITLISNIVYVRIALIDFLPLYVLYILWKGHKYIGVEEKNVGPFILMSSLSILGSAYIVSFILKALV